MPLSKTVGLGLWRNVPQPSGVPRVSSARGPMLASAPPPPLQNWRPPLVKPNPLALGQKSTSKKTKTKNGLQPEREKKDPLMHRERGALDSAAFKISPYKLGGRPLQGLRPGAMPPPCPHPRYATATACLLLTVYRS